MGLSSAPTPSEVRCTPLPACSIFNVMLFGAGPGLYFDLSTLSFHVPTIGSVPFAPAPVMNAAAAANASPHCNLRNDDFIFPPPGDVKRQATYAQVSSTAMPRDGSRTSRHQRSGDPSEKPASSPACSATGSKSR